jgi:hypothetical protein
MVSLWFYCDVCFHTVQASLHMYSLIGVFSWKKVYSRIHVTADVKVRAYLFIHHRLYHLNIPEAFRLSLQWKIVLCLWICLYFLQLFCLTFAWFLIILWTVLLMAKLLFIDKECLRLLPNCMYMKERCFYKYSDHTSVKVAVSYLCPIGLRRIFLLVYV